MHLEQLLLHIIHCLRQVVIHVVVHWYTTRAGIRSKAQQSIQYLPYILKEVKLRAATRLTVKTLN